MHSCLVTVLRFNGNPVIDGSLQPLLAPEVPSECLCGHSMAQTRPILLIDRKIAPSVRPLASFHSSIADFTQAGIGTLRMCPAFPIMRARWKLADIGPKQTTVGDCGSEFDAR